MNSVADFHFAKYLIDKICSIRGQRFYNIPVEFAEPLGFIDGCLNVGNPKDIGHTLFNIVSIYLENFESFSGKTLYQTIDDKKAVNTYLVSTLNHYMQTERFFIKDDIYVQSLYQNNLIWSLMKNIICPYYDVSVKNIKLSCFPSAYLDFSKYFSKDDPEKPEDIEEEFIYVNSSVGNGSVRNLFLFIETLKAHGLDCFEVVQDIFYTDLYVQVKGLLSLAFSDEKVAEFLYLLLDLFNLKPDLLLNSNVKTAQALDTPYNDIQWWYFGLPEKMLEPARGEDWSVTLTLQKWTKDFLEQVEKIKSKKPQGEGVNFNDLLRLKQVQTLEAIDPTLSIQALLSDKRVW